MSVTAQAEPCTCNDQIHLLDPPARLPALVLALVLPARLGRDREGEVDVAAHVPVVLVLVRQLRDELGREGDEEALKKVTVLGSSYNRTYTGV